MSTYSDSTTHLRSLASSSQGGGTTYGGRYHHQHGGRGSSSPSGGEDFGTIHIIITVCVIVFIVLLIMWLARRSKIQSQLEEELQQQIEQEEAKQMKQLKLKRKYQILNALESNTTEISMVSKEKLVSKALLLDAVFEPSACWCNLISSYFLSMPRFVTYSCFFAFNLLSLLLL